MILRKLDKDDKSDTKKSLGLLDDGIAEGIWWTEEQ